MKVFAHGNHYFSTKYMKTKVNRNLSFATDSSCQLDVLWHDGDSLGVDGAEVGVFKDSDQVSFTGFLEGHDSG